MTRYIFEGAANFENDEALIAESQAYACESCGATNVLVEIAPHEFVSIAMHEAGCAWYAAQEKEQET